MYMHKCLNNQNPKCDYCGLNEDNIHLFINCTPQQYTFTLNTSNTNKFTTNLTVIVIQIILFEIWQSRNNNKYNKKLLPQQTIQTK